VSFQQKENLIKMQFINRSVVKTRYYFCPMNGCARAGSGFGVGEKFLAGGGTWRRCMFKMVKA